MLDHPEMNAYMAACDTRMQDYIRTPKVVVTLPSGAILTYHESSDDVRRQQEGTSAMLRKIQADMRRDYSHLFRDDY